MPIRVASLLPDVDELLTDVSDAADAVLHVSQPLMLMAARSATANGRDFICTASMSESQRRPTNAMLAKYMLRAVPTRLHP